MNNKLLFEVKLVQSNVDQVKDRMFNPLNCPAKSMMVPAIPRPGDLIKQDSNEDFEVLKVHFIATEQSVTDIYVVIGPWVGQDL